MIVMRVARPTDRLEKIAAMYRKGLGMLEIGRFEDHAGFDGIMLGFEGHPYHLEFTTERGRLAEGAPGPENLLIFYEPDGDRWRERCETMASAGFRSVASHNPYWDQNGRTFEDPDGYRVVIQNGEWTY